MPGANRSPGRAPPGPEARVERGAEPLGDGEPVRAGEGDDEAGRRGAVPVGSSARSRSRTPHEGQ